MRANAVRLLLWMLACASVVWMQNSAFGEYLPKGKRDPFVALLTPEGQRVYPPGLDEQAANGLSELTLQGIVYDPNAQSYAVINGQVVEEQAEVDGVKILKIEPTSVTVLIEGQTSQLTLKEAAKEDQREP